jgi:hypothetical protein
MASKRPVNSSQSVTTRLVGCATVTGGGGAAACSFFSPHAPSVSKAKRGINRRRLCEDDATRPETPDELGKSFTTISARRKNRRAIISQRSDLSLPIHRIGR